MCLTFLGSTRPARKEGRGEGVASGPAVGAWQGNGDGEKVCSEPSSGVAGKGWVGEGAGL